MIFTLKARAGPIFFFLRFYNTKCLHKMNVIILKIRVGPDSFFTICVFGHDSQFIPVKAQINSLKSFLEFLPGRANRESSTFV